VPEWSERKPSQHPFHKNFLKDMDDFTFASPDDILENFLNEETEYPREEMDAETLVMLKDF
jgi:hypothetical protein